MKGLPETLTKKLKESETSCVVAYRRSFIGTTGTDQKHTQLPVYYILLAKTNTTALHRGVEAETTNYFRYQLI